MDMLPKEEYEKLDPKTQEFIRYQTLLETHNTVKKLDKTIHGNNGKGLIREVDEIGSNQKWLWGWLTGLSATMGWIIKSIMK